MENSSKKLLIKKDMKKIYSFILVSFFVVFSCYGQHREMKKYTKNIFKEQKKLVESQISETQKKIKQTDSVENQYEYYYYKMILQSLNEQLEITETNSDKYCSNTKSNLSSMKLVGEWYLEDYEDDVERNEEGKKDLELNVANLKEHMKLIFYPDLTFQRYGFTQTVEEGDWRLGEDGKSLFLKRNDAASEDEINIENFNDTSITFVIFDSYNETTTKLILKKK